MCRRPNNLDLYIVDIKEFLVAKNAPEPNQQKEEGVRHLTTNLQGDIHPDWSPDGSKVAFTRQENPTRADVYILDLFTRRITLLSGGAAYNGYPCWSPDGAKVAFSSNRDGSFGIWVVDVDGSNIARIHDKLGEDEILSQDGWHAIPFGTNFANI